MKTVNPSKFFIALSVCLVVVQLISAWMKDNGYQDPWFFIFACLWALVATIITIWYSSEKQ